MCIRDRYSATVMNYSLPDEHVTIKPDASYDLSLIHIYMKNKWLKNSNRQHLRYSMRQASGIALALVKGISVAAAGHTPVSYTHLDEAKKMMNRLKNKGKRFKLSYDGQVLRIINLPKNYKDYPYIPVSYTHLDVYKRQDYI